MGKRVAGEHSMLEEEFQYVTTVLISKIRGTITPHSVQKSRPIAINVIGLTPSIVSPDATALRSVKFGVYSIFCAVFHADFASF